jgi:hypothetical protein
MIEREVSDDDDDDDKQTQIHSTWSEVHIIIIIIGPTVLVRTLAASHRRFRNLFWHTVGLLWTSDQPAAEASTYTGQRNI